MRDITAHDGAGSGRPERRLHTRAVTVDQSCSAIGLGRESCGCGTASARL